MALGEAFVEILPDTSKFDAAAMAGIQRSIRNIASAFDSLGDDIVQLLSSDLAGLDFDDVVKNAVSGSKGISGAFEDAADDSNKYLSTIGGDFDQPVAAAVSAGNGVEDAFVDGAEGANQALAGIGKTGFEGVLSAARSAGDKIGTMLSGGVDAAKAGMGTAGVAAGALLAQSLHSGFQRFSTIQDARSLFEQLLGSASEAQEIMDEIVGVVTGTPFNLDQFAKLGSQMVALNVDASKVPQYLTAIGEAAATQGSRALMVSEQLGNAFGEMATFGRVTGETMWQLQAAGVPAMKILANEFGVTAEEMQKMISNGMVPAERAMDALSEGIINGSQGIAGSTAALGGSMAKLRENVTGAFGGMQAAQARFGAAIVTELAPMLVAGFGAVSKILDGLGVVVGNAMKNLMSTPAMTSFVDWLNDIASSDKSSMVERISGALKEFSGVLGPLLGMLGALGATSLAGFLGPFGAMIPAVTGVQGALIGLILTNEEVRSSFADMATGIIDAFAPIVPAISDAFAQLAAAVGDLLAALAPVVAELAEFGAAIVSGILPAIGPLSTAISAIASALGAIPAPVIAAIAAFVGFQKVGSGLLGLGDTIGNIGVKISGFTTKGGDALVGLGSKMQGLAGSAGLWGAGLAAAIGVGMFAWDAFTAKEREITERALEVSGALGEQVEATIAAGDSASSAAVGLDALSTALTLTGEDGEKTTEALGTLGLQGKETVDVLTSIADDPVTAMTKWAMANGIGAERARELAVAINETDLQISHGNRLLDETTGKYIVMSESEVAVARALEELQDQQGKTDLDGMIRPFLLQEAAMTENQEAILALAEGNTGLSRSGKDLLPLYVEYTRLIDENTDASGELTIATEALSGSELQAMNATERLNAVVAMQTVTVEESAAAMQATADAAKVYTDAVTSEDWGMAAFEGAQVALAGYTSELFGLQNIAQASEEAFGGLRKVNEDFAFTLDQSTEAGRAWGDQLEGLAGTLDTRFAAAFDGADGDMGKFNESAKAIGEETLARLNEELNLTPEQLEEVRTQLGLTEGDYEARFKLSGDEEARMKLTLLQGAMEGLPEDVALRVNSMIAAGDLQGAVAEIQSFYDTQTTSIGVDADTTKAQADLAGLTTAEYVALVKAFAETGEAGATLEGFTEFERIATIDAIAQTLPADTALADTTEEQRTAIIESLANVAPADSALASMTEEDRTALINSIADTAGASIPLSEMTTEQRTAVIDAIARTFTANAELNDTAEDRDSDIDVSSNAATVGREIDNAAKNRTSTITVTRMIGDRYVVESGMFVPGGSWANLIAGEISGRVGDEVVLPLGKPGAMQSLISDPRVYGRLSEAMSAVNDGQRATAAALSADQSRRAAVVPTYAGLVTMNDVTIQDATDADLVAQRTVAALGSMVLSG